jgi:hypothetical protein
MNAARRVVSVIVGMTGCLSVLAACGSDAENERRLHVLQNDQVLHCHLAGATPWKVLDMPGTTFAGGAVTRVLRDLRRTGDRRQVNTEVAACAGRAGWSLHPQPARLPGFWATKRFEDRWDATLSVDPDVHIFGHAAVVLTIETDPV